MPAPTEALVSVRHVTKSYRTPQHEFLALRDIDLEVRTGEFVCLLGPSGCGKSTLLRLITGLQPASSGEVLYRGTPVVGVNPHATIVFQTFALYPWLTVLGNVELALSARGIAADTRRTRALELIDTVGLAGFASAYPRELSGGMRQKVGFARAMAVEPELLCLDEPFSALDVLSAEALRGELMELWLNRSLPIRAILMVTHNIEEAVLMASRIVVMGTDPGRIVTSMEITLRHPRVRKDTAFQALVDKVYGAVAGPTRADSETPSPATTTLSGRPLPAARLNAVAGLTEKLVLEGSRTDLYRIAQDLQLELDDLLPLVEAAELLGFVKVEQGDLLLTPLGNTFAGASIPARKEIVAGRVLRHPTVRWIYETLQGDDNQRVAGDFFADQLGARLGDAARVQLERAILWGRYAELFAYDDGSREFYLVKEDT